MNDERPIEKLLRRHARQRGEEAGAPFSLHPANRRLLQGEVARQFPQPAVEPTESARDFFARLTRRWIYAVGVLVVLGVAAVLILPLLNEPKPLGRLAQSSPAKETTRNESRPAPTVSTPATDARTKQETQRALEPDNRLAAVPVATVPADNFTAAKDVQENSLASNGGPQAMPALAPATKPTADKKVVVHLNQESAEAVTLNRPPVTSAAENQASSRARSLAAPVTTSHAAEPTATARFADQQPATPAAAAAVAANPSPSVRAIAGQKPLTQAASAQPATKQTQVQSFTNLASDQRKTKARSAVAPPRAPVLANFQMEQVGNQLRVIDSDGSTYLGNLNAVAANYAAGDAVSQPQAVTDFKRVDQTAASLPARALPPAQTPAVNYQWRVEGTNHTLNQNVVFTWNFVETNALAVSQLPAGVTQAPVPFPARLQGALIYGRAQLGNGPEIEINAVPENSPR